MIDKISLTIGIITKDRPDFLEKCLENKFKQLTTNVSILISDDSFDEENIRKNKILCKQYKANYIKGPRRGLYANRNNIMNNIKTSHLLTCDDDHLYPKNFIKLIYKEIEKYQDEILVVGEVKNNKPFLINKSMPKFINELGRISENNNPNSIKGISCGSTIYPLNFLNMQIRCDESYLFGRIWYLFALQIQKFTSFNIRFITSTSIKHNIISSQDRKNNIAFFKHQQECNLYVSFIHTFYFSKNKFCLINLIWKITILLFIGRKIHGQKGRFRIGIKGLLIVIKNTFKNKKIYN